MNPSDPNANPPPPGPTFPEPVPGPTIPTEEPPGLVPPPTPAEPQPERPETPVTPFPTHPEPAPGDTPDTPPTDPSAIYENPAPFSAVSDAGLVEAPAEVRTAPTPIPAQPVPAVPPAPQPHDLSRIAQDLQIRKAQVEAVVQLLDEENTVPFITRYRKERTGGLNEEAIRRIQERIGNLRSLAERKRTILKSIAYQGKLNDALVEAILAAEFPKRLEDLYLPYKPKKKSKATEAREKGLGPVAEAILQNDPAVANLAEVLPGLVDPDKWLLHTDDVLAGIKDVLADLIADSAEVRGPLRNYYWDMAQVAATKVETLAEGKGKEYEPYFNFHESVRDIPPHRILAINRGEKANVLKVKIEAERAKSLEIAAYHLGLYDHPHGQLLGPVMEDALDRLVLPSLEREIRRELTERAQDHAILVFARNLRSLLLQPPLRGKRVLAVDPGIRTGCKLAVLDETGKLLEDAVIYPQGQKRNATESKRKLEQLVRKYQIPVIAIGNGTGCRDAEQLVADLIGELEQRRLNPSPVVSSDAAPPVTSDVPSPVQSDAPMPTEPPVVSETPLASASGEATGTIVSDAVFSAAEGTTISSDVIATPASVETTGTAPPTSETVTTGSMPATPQAEKRPEISLEGLPEAPPELAYVIVIEAGASDYSASPVAREEFPNLDATTRGTVSIGRRLQDPLAELVKIDPQHIGVGLYQHDVKPKHLKESLEGVIESSVNAVGVDLNTASVPLLRHVSGMNQLVAREVVDYRNRHGAFTSREQLLQVPGLGEKRYTQAAGFLKLPESSDPLDTTWIHPESYPLARQILADLGYIPQDLRDAEKLKEIRAKFNALNLSELAMRLKAGEPTLDDILSALARPGRDPREDLPPPIFKTGVLKLEDISPGMELKGTVLNVVPFGAFVDIGLKESGLVHISQMANRYIKSPYDVVAVGDVVTVWVIEVKPGEKKISLSMIAPGQERRPMERGERTPERFADAPPREQREHREPRGRGPGGPPPQQQSERQGAPRGERQGAGPRGGQGQGGPRRFERGPSGRGPGGPPPRQGQGAGPQQVEGSPPPQQQQPPPPPRKPAKPKPLPNLTGDKKTGKAALNTFAELAAFFKTKDEPEKGPEPPKPDEPKVEEEKGEAPPTT